MVFVSHRDKESAASLLRRFTRKTQQAGLLLEARRVRFKRKPPSSYKKRRSAIRRIKIRRLHETLFKQGIIKEGEQIPQQLKKKFEKQRA